jgi:hypothetical protein
MTTYVCIYCQENLPSFSEILTHVIESHSEQTLKFSQKDGANIKVKNFKIIPEICRQQGRSITVNKTRETIHIARCNTVAKDSPCGKVSKPTDNDSFDDIEVDKSEDLSLLVDDKDEEYTEIVSLIPTVIDQLKRAGKLTEYISFHKLVNDGKFPLDNLACLLFLDVVRWFGTETAIYSTRYSEEIKLFWKTELRLFHLEES